MHLWFVTNQLNKTEQIWVWAPINWVKWKVKEFLCCLQLSSCSTTCILRKNSSLIWKIGVHRPFMQYLEISKSTWCKIKLRSFSTKVWFYISEKMCICWIIAIARSVDPKKHQNLRSHLKNLLNKMDMMNDVWSIRGNSSLQSPRSLSSQTEWICVSAPINWIKQSKFIVCDNLIEQIHRDIPRQKYMKKYLKIVAFFFLKI